MDKSTAEMVNANYLEVVGAPDFEEGVFGSSLSGKTSGS